MTAEQLPLVFNPLARYDREPVGAQQPLTAHELAALAHHGYRLVEAYDTSATFDTPDGLTAHDNDFWRSEIDVFYLIARHLAARDGDPGSGA